MEENDKRDRYKDIVNVHAAALNASVAEDRPYRSLDDADAESDREEQLYGYTMPAHEQLNGSKVYQEGSFFREADFTKDDQALSECDHYVRDVRRNNFIQMWLNEYNADGFIATHMYGAMNDVSMVDIDDCDKEDALNTSVQLLSATFVGRVKKFNR